MSILIFIAVLFVLVLVHELGHFAVAKWTGMRVDEFGIGFPPRLFGIKKGETLYSINALPIGGFVKIFGEDGAGDPSARPSEVLLERSDEKNPEGVLSRYEKDDVDTESSPVTSEARDRRSEALAEAGEGGEDGTVTRESAHSTRSFTSKNKWAQSAVLLAGVTMNVFFAWLLVVLAFGIGVQGVVSEEEAGDSARLTITHVFPGSPAGLGELTAGSVIKSVEAEGEVLAKLAPSAFTEFVASHKDALLTIAYTSGSELKLVQLRAEPGVIADRPEQPAIGVALAQIDIKERSLSESVVDATKFVVTGLTDITVGLFMLLYNALRFEADFSQIAGPIGIVGLVGEASAFGLTSLLMFTAFISLNLAVINILPFPALDGGRLLFVFIEALKGSPITPRYVAVLNAIGFFILIGLMVVVTWNDIARLI